MHRALFEVSYIGNLQGFLNIILGFVIFFLLFFRVRKENMIVVMRIMIVFIAVHTVFLVKSYMDIVIAYKSGDYIEIEGTVKNYSSTMGTEIFTVDGVKFKCSAKTTPWGYYKYGNTSLVEGVGRRLRIRYIPNKHKELVMYVGKANFITGNGEYAWVRYIPDKHRNTIVYIEQLKPEEAY